MKTYQQQKDQARQTAIEIQSNATSLSYYELCTITDRLCKIGRKWGLLGEFKENGLI